METPINDGYAMVCNAEPLILIALQYQAESWNDEDI